MPLQTLPEYLAAFVSRYCFDAPSTAAIEELLRQHPLLPERRCLLLPYQVTGCAHVLCGSNARADAASLQRESRGIARRIIFDCVRNESRQYSIDEVPAYGMWSIDWRGGLTKSEMCRALSVLPYLKVALARTPLAREERSAIRRLSRYLAVPLPFYNDPVPHYMTREYTVRLESWADFVLDGRELRRWVRSIANGEPSLPAVREEDLVEALFSTNVEHRELAMLLTARPDRARARAFLGELVEPNVR